ncbi:MAG TPA: restriction endonuclease, partial [Clostridia bacterium]|nr:restriction endonuclease [Clostridia bacterium]
SKINRRIEVLYDREHTIGHAYFLPLKDNPTLEQLGCIFEQKIVPLLQEYFFDDYEKIRLVLGDENKDTPYQFIIKKPVDHSDLFGKVDLEYDETAIYEINKAAFFNINSYKGI